MTGQKKVMSLALQKTFYKTILMNFLDLIADAREINKAHTTFIDSITKHSAHNGRIHADINQIRSDARWDRDR